MPRQMERIPLELGLRLNINRLLRDGVLISGQKTQLKDYLWFDGDGEKIARAQITAEMTEGAEGTRPGHGAMRIVADWIDQTIHLVARARHFGGQQWYFVCPRNGDDVAILWSPPGKRFFAGRRSWGKHYAYVSQYHGSGPRAHYMARKLCDRIGGPGASDQWDVAPKPKGMRWGTYESLSRRCEEYWSKATTLPIEYRHYGSVV
jgi:hypothetical protein